MYLKISAYSLLKLALFLITFTLTDSSIDLNENVYQDEKIIKSVSECPNFAKFCSIKIRGTGWTKTELNKRTYFDLYLYPNLNHSGYSYIPFKNNDTVIKARLYGTTIVNADVDEIELGHYIVSYELKDVGEYNLQIRLVWLTGASLYYDNFLDESIFQLKSIYIDCQIFNETIYLKGNQLTEENINKPLCTEGNHPGRWVKINNNVCPSWVCYSENPSSLSILNDLFHFNHEYIWSPWDCNYKIFSGSEVKKCLLKNNIELIHLSGDSLVREHFQNIISILTNKSASMRKVLFSMEFLIPLDDNLKPKYEPFDSNLKNNNVNDNNNNKMVRVVFDPDNQIAGVENSWYLWDVPLMHHLSSGDFDSAPIVKAKHNLMRPPLPRKSTYYIHPQIQREDPRVQRDLFVEGSSNRWVSPFSFMTPIRQLKQNDRIKNVLNELNLKFIDAYSITKSRWESSWDGIHYSMVSIDEQLKPDAKCLGGYRRGGRNMCWTIKTLPGINKCEGGYMYWCKHVYNSSTVFSSFEGGVSQMLTMIWINMMCNE